jgi:hypothetical protein
MPHKLLGLELFFTRYPEWRGKVGITIQCNYSLMMNAQHLLVYPALVYGDVSARDIAIQLCNYNPAALFNTVRLYLHAHYILLTMTPCSGLLCTVSGDTNTSRCA